MTNNDQKAYIGIEREEQSVKYTAKNAGQSKREISKLQYNAIVKALNEQDWSGLEEDDAAIINRIIKEKLELGDE